MSERATYRSLFRWGDPRHVAPLDERAREFLREALGLERAPQRGEGWLGERPLGELPQPGLAVADLQRLEGIVGSENVDLSPAARLRHAIGRSFLDLLRLRLGAVPPLPDAVVYPRHEEDVLALLALCSERGIPLTPFGGGSSVTGGVECPRRGISLDLTRNMNRVLAVDETSLSVRVQPGIFGPALERALAACGRGYTCGHFPQSFEFSTVGGWVSTRGAGQESTGCGKIEDLLLAVRLATPRGILRTSDYPAAAIGPDLNRLVAGSEGAFGVLTEATLRIFPRREASRRLFSYLFPTWEEALEALRAIVQAGCGMPRMLRLSDAEETDVFFKQKGMDGSRSDRLLRALGYRPPGRCLLIGFTEGHHAYARAQQRCIHQLARRGRGLPLFSGPVRKWLASRFTTPYLREPLMDLGVLVDTLETSASWSRLPAIWEAGRRAIKSRPRAICMCHVSHVYESGANLYFTYLSRLPETNEIEEYLGWQRAIVDAFRNAGGAISHHHGVGKHFARWMPGEWGETGLELLRAIKRHLDPRGVLNPGGTLGLDAPGASSHTGRATSDEEAQ
jgi:alkyldihydroxyacetonephosphate synthase